MIRDEFTSEELALGVDLRSIAAKSVRYRLVGEDIVVIEYVRANTINPLIFAGRLRLVRRVYPRILPKA